jgi:hypothetical protein
VTSPTADVVNAEAVMLHDDRTRFYGSFEEVLRREPPRWFFLGAYVLLRSKTGSHYAIGTIRPILLIPWRYLKGRLRSFFDAQNACMELA